MISIDAFVVIAKTAFGLFCLWLLWCVLWRELHLDIFRQRLFNIRNELFRLAAGGGIAFNHPAYVLLRDRINFIIRFAHWFTFTRMAAAYVLVTKRDPDSANRVARGWRQAVAEIESQDSRKKVQELHLRVNVVVGSSAAWGSLSALVVVPFLILMELIKNSPATVPAPQPCEGEMRVRLADWTTSALEAHEDALLAGDEEPPELVPAG